MATYMHRDGLSSVRAITDPAGVKIESALYKPFGEQSEWVLPGNIAPETKGWIGERFDADAGLQYLNARYYDPELSLFLQPDWFEVTKAGVGTNRFSYAFNDPVNKLDPGGNETYGYDRDDFYRKLRNETKAVLPGAAKEVGNAAKEGAGLLGKIAYEVSPLGAADNIYHGYQEGNYWKVAIGVAEITPWGKVAGKIISKAANGAGDVARISREIPSLTDAAQKSFSIGSQQFAKKDGKACY